MITTFSTAAVLQGMAYGAVSCLNSFGYFHSFNPLNAATTAGVFTVTNGLLDLAGKQITSLNWIGELLKEEETTTIKVLLDKTLTEDEKTRLGKRKSEISKELEPYRLIRSIMALAITYFTQSTLTSFANQALSCAVTYLPNPESFLKFCDFISLSPTALCVATIFAIGSMIFSCEMKKKDDERIQKSLFVKELEEKLEKVEIKNHEFSLLKDSDFLPMTLLSFGAFYGLIAAINAAAGAVNTRPITVSTYYNTYFLYDKLLHFGVKQFSSLNWVYKLPGQLEMINEELKKYEDVSLDGKTKEEKFWLSKKQHEIIGRIKQYKSIVCATAIALTYFTGDAATAFVSSALNLAVTYLPSRFAIAACSTLSITPISLVAAMIALTGVVLLPAERQQVEN